MRLDPLVPIYGKVQGQSKEEIETFIKELADVGVKRIISRCLHLAIPVKELQSKPHLKFYNALEPLYRVNGFELSKRGRGAQMMALNIDTRRKLLVHVYEACTKHGISLSTCDDPAFFKGSTSCDRVVEDLKLGHLINQI